MLNFAKSVIMLKYNETALRYGEMKSMLSVAKKRMSLVVVKKPKTKLFNFKVCFTADGHVTVITLANVPVFIICEQGKRQGPGVERCHIC